MKNLSCFIFLVGFCLSAFTQDSITLNLKADGYRGIWYQNQPLDNAYKFKYSGGLGTYCAKHNPFAVYSPVVNKTFFSYGGVPEGYHEKYDLSQTGLDRLDVPDALHHMVSYYDHTTGRVPRPTILLNKRTHDAHDNPVISMDDEGYIWIFSTSHGTSRTSYIHKSSKPYEIDVFKRVHATYLLDGEKVPLDNFSYMQIWYVAGQGFVGFFTKYNSPAKRTNVFMRSKDGINWSEWTRLAAIEEGHYQISAVGNDVMGAAFNYHPKGQGLNWRTNLYYMETRDQGESWQSVNGDPLNLPLIKSRNSALIHDYESEGLKVYLKDIQYDEKGHPAILFITSKGHESGPENGPRTWRIAHWLGERWQITTITTSDNNYDMGSLWFEPNGTWHIIAPTETGPQPFNPGGEIAHWISKDQGQSWEKELKMTKNSSRNHTYVRKPVNAHPDFFAIWADGDGRKPSISRLYFSDKNGKIFRLPEVIKGKFGKVERIEN